MATEDQNGAVSDAGAPEGPVREQLRNASISKAPDRIERADVKPDDRPTSELVEQAEDGSTDADKDRGRTHQQQSSGEAMTAAEEDAAAKLPRQTTRKRSRDSTAEEEELNNGQRKSHDRSREPSEEVMRPSSKRRSQSPELDRPRTPEPNVEKTSTLAEPTMTSPKVKRSRLESEEANGVTAADAVPKKLSKLEPTTESTTEVQEVATSPPPNSGFGNTSAASPFASLAGSKSPTQQPTSPGAFAASGFSSLTGTASGFGSIGKSTGGFGSGGGFATGGKTSSFSGGSTMTEPVESKDNASSTSGEASVPKSVFAASGSASTSAFGGGSASGFGKLSGSNGFGGGLASTGGFGSFGTGAGLSSFASGKPSAALAGSSKSSKTFGAAAADDEAAEDEGQDADESGFKSPLSQESDKQDERFYVQDLETGEEGEATEYSCRAKLYNFVANAEGKKEWKERGLGVIRLNVQNATQGDDASSPRARLLMRADGSHRVILNTPVTKEIKFGAPKGGPPTGGYIYFMGAVDGKASLELMQLKVCYATSAICCAIGELT